MKMHTAEPLVPEPSPPEVETDQIAAKMIGEGGHYDLSSINSLILFGIRNNFLSSGRSQFRGKKIKLTVVIIEAYHCYQFYPTSLLKFTSIHRRNCCGSSA
jgi:hypothetical protein